jgi:hypothetical protein
MLTLTMLDSLNLQQNRFDTRTASAIKNLNASRRAVPS